MIYKYFYAIVSARSLNPCDISVNEYSIYEFQGSGFSCRVILGARCTEWLWISALCVNSQMLTSFWYLGVISGFLAHEYTNGGHWLAKRSHVTSFCTGLRILTVRSGQVKYSLACPRIVFIEIHVLLQKTRCEMQRNMRIHYDGRG